MNTSSPITDDPIAPYWARFTIAKQAGADDFDALKAALRTTSPTAARDVTEEMVSELQRRVIEDTGCFVRKAWASETLEGILAMRAVSLENERN